MDSGPIKVISKAGTALPKEPKTVGGGTKRTINQVVEHNIDRIAEQQQAILEMQQRQLELLQVLVSPSGFGNSWNSTPEAFSSPIDVNLSPDYSPHQTPQRDLPLDLGAALAHLAAAYSRIEPAQRSSKVRKAMLSLDDDGKTDVSDFLKLASGIDAQPAYPYGFPDSESADFGGGDF